MLCFILHHDKETCRDRLSHMIFFAEELRSRRDLGGTEGGGEEGGDERGTVTGGSRSFFGGFSC